MFTRLFQEYVVSYLIIMLCITCGNLVIELIATLEFGDEPKRYFPLFLALSLPVSIGLLVIWGIRSKL